MNHLYEIALTFIKGIGQSRIKHLLATHKSAEAIFGLPKVDMKIFGLGSISISRQEMNNALKRAEQEILFNEKNGIISHFIFDKSYPYRLKECEDAPIILYQRGQANLNSGKFVAVVGTRNATHYGKELTTKLIAEIPKSLADISIVSGLAYGIDGTAHKVAVKESINTIAVVAHGLDMLYPTQHRQLAERIVEQGGAIITEYPTQTIAEAGNFVQRNRIIAGISDATVIVESATKGGALLTANAANAYSREVFAFPGRVDDVYSQGCNNLIKTHRAQMITNTTDLLDMMGWTQSPTAIQPSLFVELTDEEQTIVEALRRSATGVNELSRELNIPIQKLISMLILLEFKGAVKALPGNVYKA